MPSTNPYYWATQSGDLKNWLKIIRKRLELSNNRAVFLAVGPTLQEAMIASEVISIQRQQANEALPIERFNELYAAACRQHMPDYYTPEAK